MCCEKLRAALGGDEKHYDNRLAAQENGQRFAIQLPKGSEETFCRAKIDAGVIPEESEQERCDFLFSRCSNDDIYFLELKGKDVKKGFSQITSTIAFARPKLKIQPEQVTGFIIVSRCPLNSAALQVLRNKFKKQKYGHTLEVHSREWTHKI